VREHGLSFIRSRASHEGSVNDNPVKLLRNFTSTGMRLCAVRAEKREERIGESTARRNPADRRRLSFYSGVATTSSSLLVAPRPFPPFNYPFRQPRSRRSGSAVSEIRSSLRMLYFIVTARTRQLPASLPSKRLREMSNAVFEFA
jgi:hypothetical protein